MFFSKISFHLYVFISVYSKHFSSLIWFYEVFNQIIKFRGYVQGVDDLYFSRLLNNLLGRRIFQSSTSYRTFNFTNVRFNLTGSFTGHIKAIFFTVSQFYETLAPFLSNGDFEGDKTKTLPWSCSAVIFAGNLSDYDESRFSFMPQSIFVV